MSLRNVEDLLSERAIDICHETVRLWWNRFGPMFAAEIRRKPVGHMRAYTHWLWHLDEIYVRINGEALESFASKTRDKATALTFMKKIMKRHGRAKAITTDGLRSYKDAMKELGNTAKQVLGRRLNNRAEKSHLPCRRREQAMLRFRQMKALAA